MKYEDFVRAFCDRWGCCSHSDLQHEKMMEALRAFGREVERDTERRTLERACAWLEEEGLDVASYDMWRTLWVKGDGDE